MTKWKKILSIFDQKTFRVDILHPGQINDDLMMIQTVQTKYREHNLPIMNQFKDSLDSSFFSVLVMKRKEE